MQLASITSQPEFISMLPPNMEFDSQCALKKIMSFSGMPLVEKLIQMTYLYFERKTIPLEKLKME